MVAGSQAKKRSAGGAASARRLSSSDSSIAMFMAPSSGSVTSRRKAVVTRAPRSHPALSPEGRGLLRLAPPQNGLAGRQRLVEPAHRGRERRLVDDVRVGLRLAGDLDHRVAELIERLLGLGLGR